ncbi:MAG: type 1 glutamine amidotransferase [Oscillospiraceae bacterium]
MTIQYLQHIEFENPGSILTWASEKGVTVNRTLLFAGEVLPQPDAFDWLVVMGGPMNIYEEDKYPWLAAEKALIRAAAGAGKTIIGLCLGAQLIADALGGKVTRNPAVEIGWHTIKLTDAARRSEKLSFLPDEAVVFQWHGDTFSTLPTNAVQLAESEACANQAFCVGDQSTGSSSIWKTRRKSLKAYCKTVPTK